VGLSSLGLGIKKNIDGLSCSLFLIEFCPVLDGYVGVGGPPNSHSTVSVVHNSQAARTGRITSCSSFKGAMADRFLRKQSVLWKDHLEPGKTAQNQLIHYHYGS
jgi:hypothetical protein